MLIVLCINYDGTHFSGFQIQPSVRTIQGELENALFSLYKVHIRIHSAGRTDAGVHALRQYVHFSLKEDCNISILPDKISYALNRFLPSDIRVEYSREIHSDFHARYSAESRSYCYIMHEGNVPTTWRTCMVTLAFSICWDTWYRDALELIGKHDFSILCAKSDIMHKNNKSTIRIIKSISLVRYDNIVQFFIEANGFLWHMVRNIVGMLMYRASLSQEKYNTLPSVTTLLGQKKRINAIMGTVAPSHGLYLYDVRYNTTYGMLYNEIPVSSL